MTADQPWPELLSHRALGHPPSSACISAVSDGFCVWCCFHNSDPHIAIASAHPNCQIELAANPPILWVLGKWPPAPCLLLRSPGRHEYPGMQLLCLRSVGEPRSRTFFHYIMLFTLLSYSVLRLHQNVLGRVPRLPSVTQLEGSKSWFHQALSVPLAGRFQSMVPI